MYKFFFSILIVISFSKWVVANNDSNDVENSESKQKKIVQSKHKSNIEIAIDQTVEPEKRITALNSIHQRSFDRTFKPEVIDHIMTIAMNFTEQDRVRVAAIYSLEHADLSLVDLQKTRSLVKADDSNWRIRQAANWLSKPSMRQSEKIKIDMKAIFDNVFNRLFLRDIREQVTTGRLSETQKQEVVSNIIREIVVSIAIDKKMDRPLRVAALSRIYKDKLSRDFNPETINKILQISMNAEELNQIREFSLYALAEADLNVDMVEQIRKLSADNSETVEEIRQAALWLMNIAEVREKVYYNFNISQQFYKEFEISIEQPLTEWISENRNIWDSITEQQRKKIKEKIFAFLVLKIGENKKLGFLLRISAFTWIYKNSSVERFTREQINSIINIAMDLSEPSEVRTMALANLERVELDRSTFNKIKMDLLSTENNQEGRKIVNILIRRIEIQIKMNQNKSAEEIFGKSFETSIADWLEGRLSEVYSKKIRSLLNVSTDRRRSSQQRMAAFDNIRQMSGGDELDTEILNRIINVVIGKEESDNLREQAITALEGMNLTKEVTHRLQEVIGSSNTNWDIKVITKRISDAVKIRSEMDKNNDLVIMIDDIVESVTNNYLEDNFKEDKTKPFKEEIIRSYVKQQLVLTLGQSETMLLSARTGAFNWLRQNRENLAQETIEGIINVALDSQEEEEVRRTALYSLEHVNLEKKVIQKIKELSLSDISNGFRQVARLVLRGADGEGSSCQKTFH